jgi:hypothetical protein
MGQPPGGHPPESSETTGLDPEDELLEVDEDGFLVTEGRSWHLPTDLDAWVMWAAILAVAVAALQTLASLAAGALEGWVTGSGSVPLPLPAGYLSLLLLGGILVLTLRRDADAIAGRARWVQAAACLAAGTGACLAIAQLVGNIGVIVRPPAEEGVGVSPAASAANVVTGIGGFTDVIAALVAAALAVMLFRWSRARSQGQGGSAVVSRQPVAGGPALASLLLGVAVAAAALVAFQAGVSGQSNEQVSIPPSSPSISLLPEYSPLPAGEITTLPSGCTRETSGICVGGVPAIEVSPAPSPAP